MNDKDFCPHCEHLCEIIVLAEREYEPEGKIMLRTFARDLKCDYCGGEWTEIWREKRNEVE